MEGKASGILGTWLTAHGAGYHFLLFDLGLGHTF